MGELTRRVINGINSASSFDDFRDWIWMGGDLIRRADSAGFHSGFEEIDHEQVSEVERRELKEALLAALPRNSDPAYVGSILSALRDTFDPERKPLWVEYLTKYLGLLTASNAIVFEILLALGDLGEPVFKGRMSRCSADIEVNVKEAREFLGKRGIQVPG